MFFRIFITVATAAVSIYEIMKENKA